MDSTSAIARPSRSPLFNPINHLGLDARAEDVCPGAGTVDWRSEVGGQESETSAACDVRRATCDLRLVPCDEVTE